ncbi:MAG: DUF1549 domain-containing protein [Bacteroidota bacterium]|nr:DUF1549 domain-containing protein [Bacteroidota bacterium]
MRVSTKNLFPGKKAVIIISVILVVCLLQFSFSGFAESSSSGAADPGTFWFWRFLGRLHPLAVHFPVGLLLFAAILELLTLKNFSSPLRPGINLLIAAGAISAIFSVIFGLLLAGDGDYGKDLITLHKWSGIAAAALGTMAWYLLNRILVKKQVKLVRSYRGVLFFCAIGITVAGHFGASLTHGKDYLTAALPWSSDYTEGKTANFDLASFKKNDTAQLTKKQILELNVKVRAILAHNCYKCHGEEKVKGELRLDRKDMIFKGGKDGPVVVPGNAHESEIYRRITLPTNDKESMPSKGKKLSDDDIAVINFWIQKGAPWPDGLEKSLFKVAALEPRNPPLPPVTGNLTNPIDRWTNQYFIKNKITWPKLVDDRTFLRRVTLDVIGLLPSPEEFETFVKDTRPDKRALWVRALLNRQDDYAMHWFTFWNDALRNDYTGTGYITKGRYNISDWLYQSIRSDKPYDQFVKELVSPTDQSKGFVEGIKWRGVVNASQRKEMQAAQNISQVFFGLNLKCTSCHNSFISDWKLDDAYAFANIFADSSLEINRCDKPTGKFTNARMLWKQLGNIDSAAPRSVKMAQLAANIIKPEDGRLYRTLVNRIWAQLMGRGLVEPVDVMDNDPWSQDLLDWMAYNFQQNKSDIKELIYLITTSETYQLPSVGFKDPNKIVSVDYKFTGMLRKRMTAEQFADAVGMVVGPLFPDSLEGYNPAKLPGYDPSNHLFARASLVVNNSFLTALGRPNRETVSTSRESQANLLQALELTNGERFNSALKKGAANWRQKYKNSDAIIKEIYSRAFNREADPKEYGIAKKLLGNNPDANSIQDLFWAILLLPEFQVIY